MSERVFFFFFLGSYSGFGLQHLLETKFPELSQRSSGSNSIVQLETSVCLNSKVRVEWYMIET